MEEVLTIDGNYKFMYAINNQFPGPTIVVYENQKVNNLFCLKYHANHFNSFVLSTLDTNNNVFNLDFFLLLWYFLIDFITETCIIDDFSLIEIQIGCENNNNVWHNELAYYFLIKTVIFVRFAYWYILYLFCII